MDLKAMDLSPAISGGSTPSHDSLNKTYTDQQETHQVELSVQIKTINTTEASTVNQSLRNGNNKCSIKLIMCFLVFAINIIVFVDAYYAFEDIEYIKDLLKTTLSVMGAHLVIEHLLENIIYSIKSDDMKLYSTTACIRDIINNIIMTLFYIFDDYSYWWKPIMWGCYIADLIMLLSKWNYFKTSWLKFVFIHHFSVGVMLLILNHTTKILTDPLLVCLIIFMNSNTPGCASPIWKAFKLPKFKYSTIICCIIQRFVRFACYVFSYRINSDNFLKQDYCYAVLAAFAAFLDVWDTYSQITSIYNYWRKQMKVNIEMLEKAENK
eukprot:271605_1